MAPYEVTMLLGRCLQLVSGNLEPIWLMRDHELIGFERATRWDRLGASEAIWLFDRVARSDGHRVRYFAHDADLMHGQCLSRVQDHQLWQVIRREIEARRLVAVRPGRGGGEDPTPSAAQRKIASEIARHCRGALVIDGQRHAMVAGDEWTGDGNQIGLEVIGRDQARALLGRAADLAATSPTLKGLLARAAEQLSPDWRRPAQPQGLVLARHQPAVRSLSPPSNEPAVTPSMAKAEALRKDPPVFAIVDLTLPPVFAPDAEEIDIAYVFSDPAQIAESATLELFAHRIAAPIWTKIVPAAHLAARRGTMKWRGKIDRIGPQLPDGYATLELSPYRLKLTARGAGREATMERQTRVEVAEVRIDTVAGTCLTNDRDRAVLAQLGDLPGTYALALDGNLFAHRQPGADHSDEVASRGRDLGYETYRDRWDGGAGPRIPLTATVLLRSSQGDAVVAGKALGRARILWDYTEPRQDPPRRMSDVNHSYLDGVTGIEAQKARPVGGRNISARLGGKRSAHAVENPVLDGPDDGVQDFPFTVAAGTNRFWSAFSKIEKDGPREGQAGVVFRPSIIAGDAYDLSAYLDVSESLDIDGDLRDGTPRAPVMACTIWRRVRLARTVRKCAAIENLAPDISPFFRTAFTEIDSHLGENVHTLTKAEYDELFEHARGVVGLGKVRATRLIRIYCLPEGVSQYDVPDDLFGEAVNTVRGFFGAESSPTSWLANFRPFDDFIRAMAVGEAWSDIEATANLEKHRLTKNRYAAEIDGYAEQIALEIASSLAAEPGVTILRFSNLHNGRDNTHGTAAHHTVSDRDRTAVLVFDSARITTLAHELGHCLFLPHAPAPPERKEIAGAKPDRHVAGAFDCMMGYADDRSFCALCQLRLRGCNGDRLDRDGLTPGRTPEE
jgi:hypothetical protein